MTAFSTLSLAATALWVAVATGAAVLVFRHSASGARPFALAGIGLIGLAAPTALLSARFAGDGSLFAPAVQLGLGILLVIAAWRRRASTAPPADDAASISFAEKSAALVLLALVLVGGLFGVRAWQSPDADLIAGIIGSVMLLVAILVAGHVAIALLHSPGDDLDATDDERDRAVRLRSTRNSHYVLAAVYWSLPVLLLADLPLATALAGWLGGLLLAEIAYYASAVYFYRRGAY